MNMDMNLGTWNVRSLGKVGRQRILLEKIKENNIKIAAIQETRWNEHNIWDTEDFTILSSGKEPGTNAGGVAFMVDRSIRGNIMDFKARNNRLCSLRISSQFNNITLINVHAPTEDSEEDMKAAFYQELTQMIEQAPSYDMKIILGDFNAHVGKETIYLGTIGMHSLHDETNDNGKRMIRLASAQNMVISSTCFPHRDIHKRTWITSDGMSFSQIDHVLVDKRRATSILDVRTMRGAACGSDHYLVRVKYRCKIPNASKGYTSKTKKIQPGKTAR